METQENLQAKKRKKQHQEKQEKESKREKIVRKKMCFRTLDCRFNNYKAMFKKVYSISTERTGITRAGQLLNFVP